ncbi:hypothetical protein [Aquimarina sp. AD10]|uniref:hypothetical protein n=1 Tax=Aquimarina sp. AD10 TaxID=1714849 RepID=UPI0013143411|nr:hypothetical protein [Aquimarina sp. AD10]
MENLQSFRDLTQNEIENTNGGCIDDSVLMTLHIIFHDSPSPVGQLIDKVVHILGDF